MGPSGGMELFESEAGGGDRERVYSVSALTGLIKHRLETGFPRVWVEGEVSNLRRPQSGHLYFTLKDERSRLAVVIFRSAAAGIGFELEEGLRIVVRGRITVYPPRGNYQLLASAAEPKGLGALQLALEQLKKKLEAEGLFAAERKLPIPPFPRRIGIVTSPTGAAIRDILQVVNRRFAGLKILINPARVQGSEAAGEIARAIDEFNRIGGVEVLIVGRGGGSLEDLWAFNEEAVVRAIARSRIPVISAVGHEIDWTLADLAADLRAPTPSAAAELVVSRKDDLLENVNSLARRLELSRSFAWENRRRRLERASGSPFLSDPSRLLIPYQQRIDDLIGQLGRIPPLRARFYRQRLESLVSRLEALSPLNVLSRGYSITRGRDGKIIRDSAALKAGREVVTTLSRGSFVSVVREVRAGESRDTAKRKN